MASNRKYAGLPDLDLAPDVYETPELTDDNSTHPAQSATETDEYDTPDISHLRLDPDAARAQFSSTRVDARETDFSDRLDSKRKAYRVSQRRRRPSEILDEGADDVDDEDLPVAVGLRRRIARLQREAREVKAEVERQQQETANTIEVGDKLEDSSLEDLSNAIWDLDHASHNGLPESASARFALRMGDAVKLSSAQPNHLQDGIDDPIDKTSYTLTYQPSFSQSHALSLAASLDTRLSAIETALGVSTLPLPTQSTDSHPKPLLPTLDLLELKLRLLTSTTSTTLDPVAARVRQLSHEADSLAEKRRAAKLNYEEMRATASDTYTHSNCDGKGERPLSGDGTPGVGITSLLGDPEVESKINALHGALPTIENVAPMLPSVVERLRSLRLVHQDAANASNRLEEVERRGTEMDEELRKWKGGLDTVESKIEQGEEAIKRNMEVVESWIDDLGKRMKALE